MEQETEIKDDTGTFVLEPSDIDLLRASSRQVVRRLGLMNRYACSTDVTHVEFHILKSCMENPELSAIDLAPQLNLNKSTVSRHLEKLRASGHIAFVAHPGDRRRKSVQLTELGQRSAAKVEKAARMQVKLALESLSPEERHTVLKGFQLYASALNRAATLSQMQFTEIKKSHDKEIAEVILSGLREFNADREGFASQDPEFYHLSVFFSQLRRNRSGNYWVIMNSETQRVIGGGGYAPLKGWNSGANRDFGRVAELQKLYLLKPYRGLGLARQLVGKILQAMKRDGYNTAYLETLSDMDKACSLYEGFGFQDVDAPMGSTGHSGCTRFMTLKLELEI